MAQWRLWPTSRHYRSRCGPVSLTQDRASGIERFEAAEVVGNISVTEKEVGVGSELTLDLEIANVGKTVATLMKLENIATEGLEINRQGINARIADNNLDLRGKRLEYLKTHEVKIPLKGKRKACCKSARESSS